MAARPTTGAWVWRRLRAAHERRDARVILSRSEVGELLAWQPRPTVIDPGYDSRTGYDELFLGVAVPLPTVAPELVDDLLRVDGGDPVLRYHHFSLAMSASRRLARWTAANLDGRRRYLTERSGDEWSYDPRIPEDAQIGEVLYVDNDLDRGHLVRRQDPVWGDSLEEALAANHDTYHFTNCAPQHSRFNQSSDTWLGLEDHILGTVAGRQLRAAVLTGPVLADSDPFYRDVAIPLEFWKVVATVDEDGTLHATAYVLSQDELVARLVAGLASPSAAGPVFGTYKTFQVAIGDLEALTRLEFGALREHDAFRPVAGERRRELTSPTQALTVRADP